MGPGPLGLLLLQILRARQTIRAAIREDGLAQRIDALVAELLETADR